VKRKLLPVIVILIIAAVISAIYWRSSHNGPAEDGSLTLYGNVDIREVRLAFNGSEHVGEMLVDEGNKVSKGQLLARLHTERIAAEHRRAEAELAAAQAEAHAAQLTFKRVRNLAKQKLASREDADVAEAKSRVADAKVDAARAALAQIDQALKDTGLHAPSDGVIRERIVEVGDFVTPQSPVFTLALTDPVWIRTYLPETWLGQVKPGSRAEIVTDSYPDKRYPAWVGAVSPSAEFTPKTVETPELRTRLVYQMRVIACNPNNELRLGMPATVILYPGEDADADQQQPCARP
jgi:HlyD family secretion protein